MSFFVAFNASFDWMFVKDYFHRFLGRNTFGHADVQDQAEQFQKMLAEAVIRG